MPTSSVRMAPAKRGHGDRLLFPPRISFSENFFQIPCRTIFLSYTLIRQEYFSLCIAFHRAFPKIRDFFGDCHSSPRRILSDICFVPSGTVLEPKYGAGYSETVTANCDWPQGKGSASVFSAWLGLGEKNRIRGVPPTGAYPPSVPVAFTGTDGGFFLGKVSNKTGARASRPPICGQDGRAPCHFVSESTCFIA